MFKGFPIMVTADNQRLYYGGSKDKNVLVWDDDEEMLQIIRVSIEPRGQDICPVEVVFIEYDTIQEITLYPDKETFIGYLTSLGLDEEDNKYALEMTRQAFHNRYSNKTPMGGKWEKKD